MLIRSQKSSFDPITITLTTMDETQELYNDLIGLRHPSQPAKLLREWLFHQGYRFPTPS